MDDPDIGNRTGQWFWDMIVSLGLGSMDDSKFDKAYAIDVIRRFLNRDYERDGKGGLFTIEHCRYDMRDIEIWYQANWYHLVIMPDEALYNAQMNTTNVTTGGYVGSAMYKSNLANAKTIVNAAFQGSVLTHREYLCNAVANGRPSGGAWFDSSIELPNEPMMYGHPHFSPTSDGSTVPSIYTISKTQLALFMVCPRFIVNRSYNQWLRDVVSSATFADVGGNGFTNFSNASDSRGVRPVFPVG